MRRALLLVERYPRFAIRFTGICTEPLIRPSLVIDDETREPSFVTAS